ncbi:MAG TPA: histidine phosphatase family protein [Chitinophagaceae bacterium]|nr:histidine phosphatase family protein [Chitinophagaceae bacterium]
MKTLVLVRHAKSSWEEAGMDDFDRPLNERGKKDAPEMAKRLKEKKIKIDLLVSSPAKRAFKTAKYFAEELNIDKEDILKIDKLYEASVTAFLEAVTSLDNKHTSAIIFSHNPGITQFANSLSTIKVDDMPTCAVFAVQSDGETWSQVVNSNKHFLFFDYPKNPL